MNGIDCRRPEVDETYGELAVVKKTLDFVYLAWRLWRSVSWLAVEGSIIYGQVVRRQRVPVFEGHRLPSTENRWDIHRVSDRGNTWMVTNILCLGQIVRRTIEVGVCAF
jgi:hypothetical protein